MVGHEIFSIGDSHAEYSFKNLKGITTLRLGPITMHRVGRDRMNFDEYLPKDCLAFFCFGEIDVRMHLYAKTLIQNEDVKIYDLADKYTDVIRSQKNITPVIVSVPPPCRWTPITTLVGDDKSRSRFCKKLNITLEKLCHDKGIMFFNAYEKYADSDGMLIMALSDGANHILNTRHFEEAFHKFMELRMEAYK